MGVEVLSEAGGAQGKGRRRRYAIVGVGDRSRLYRWAMETTYRQHVEIVGYCDANLGRLQLAQARSEHRTNASVPIFEPDAFEAMIAQTKPDAVLVMSVDGTHDAYIIGAMELGCDVICEKPMTTQAPKCLAILDAQRRTGRECRVTFNYRYSPPRTQVMDLLLGGAIGDVLSADFHWYLNTVHGADYFRRWHSDKANSGGLLVHKATHHFDLMNWWLRAVPVTVQATGKREFYTPQMARRLGLQGPHERCLTCPEKGACAFYFDLSASRSMTNLYLENEAFDGYVRDRCVFRPEINIDDTMNVIVAYDTGATLSYSLNAFNAWEGYAVAFNGSGGRLEHRVVEATFTEAGSDRVGLAEGAVTTRIYPLRGPAREIEPWTGAGDHGGGDLLLLADLFLPERPADPYARAADHRAGAWSILTGIAANESIAGGGPIRVTDLVAGLDRPTYPVSSADGATWRPPRL
jgi:predicted dehydrogenase